MFFDNGSSTIKSTPLLWIFKQIIKNLDCVKCNVFGFFFFLVFFTDKKMEMASMPIRLKPLKILV